MNLSLKVFAAFRPDPETNLYVGFCPSLGIYAHGISEKEVEHSLEDAIILFIKHSYKRSILERILKERGFTSMGNEAVSVEERMMEYVDVQNKLYTKVKDMDISINLRRNEPPKCHQQDRQAQLV